MTTLTKDWVSDSVWKQDIFKGKVAFITGGAGTICKVQAEALLLLGCNICIVGRNVDKTEQAGKDLQQLRPDIKVIAIGNVDVRQVQSLKQAVDKTVAQLGRIDFVIAGAAGNFLSDFNHLSSNAFKSVVSIDLLGSYNTVKATFHQLRKNKGSIIFVSATLHYYGVPFQVHVGAAKAGVDALSNALAVELGPLGIRSNCLAPGPIGGTEGLARLVKDLKKTESKVPLQRLGTTNDIAQATVFLFSEAASFITGVVLPVDGGSWHMGANNSTYPVEIIGRNSEVLQKL
jgi:peroxisomal 2,4-dienoyl-CoA reductase